MNDDTQTNQQSEDTGGIFGSPMMFTSNPQGQSVTTEEPLVEKKEDQNSDSVNDLVIKDSVEEQKPEDDLVSMGVTFVSDENPKKQEVNIFSDNSSFKNKDIISNIQNQPTGEPAKQEIPIIKDVPTEELENDFSETFNAPVSVLAKVQPDTTDHMKVEEEKLKKLHKELKEKASSKKIVVKERLEKLRTEKESLGKELEEIKEIEAIALKIEEKLKALVSIDTEIDSLEVQAKEELQ